ncbi:cytochrome ubiquinol oxidase subunit I [Salidesulfovibrio brasiliensis]|uniref:cytochrome ubiquinol oxidase subunit I n=1 Tax=Salidesulfovibrio brasiliensis TaxID=221711 RepID=UPI000A4E7FF1|nr:cytochrome ubiquinol oxidase subunit I [Salidesulfovibrio brasiliensis]
MEYPVWQLTTLGGGFWVALISTVHVFVAQFAVGGGLFLVVTERMARKSGSQPMLDYVRKHSKFFLLLTMVFGAVTGVAIWFSIALLAPGGALTLIHQFLFAWATEWVFFLAEIVSLLVYFYGWDRLDAGKHMAVGWLYFFFGWMSLFMINGIIGFMLTPGDWLETRYFWDGFFNPTFWPQLFFRTALCVMLAGLFGFVTGTRIDDEEARGRIVRTCAVWTLIGLVTALPTGWWYIMALPAAQYELAMQESARVAWFMDSFWIFGPAVLVGGLALGIRMPKSVGFPLALAIMLLGLGLTGSFESVREAARKPYIIWGYLYSNGIAPGDMDTINEAGMLKAAKWVPEDLREVTEDNELEAGRWLYQLQCASCHAINGPLNDIMPKSAKYTEAGFDAFLAGMGKLNRYMPPFAGTGDERAALAAYVIRDLHGREAGELAMAEPGDAEIPEYDPDEAEYVLLAWADKGLRFATDTKAIRLRPAGQNLNAMLLLRGGFPEKITEDVTVSFTAPDGFPELSDDMAANDEGTLRAEGSRCCPTPNPDTTRIPP